MLLTLLVWKCSLETIYIKESEPEIQGTQFPELEAIVVTDVIPVFDFEDEAM